MEKLMNWHDCRTMCERVTYCGDYLMVQLYPARALSAKGSRQKRYRVSREVQTRLNRKNACRKLCGLLHTNFTPKDTALHLTYSAEHQPRTAEEAHRNLYNFIRRMKRAWSKATGQEPAVFKYVEVVEIGRKGKIHHHLVISGGMKNADIQKVWKMGSTRAEALRFDENGISGLTSYITKDNLRIRYRSWSASKNLVKPLTELHYDRIAIETALYINENPLYYSNIEQLYPGYTVCPYSVEVSADTLYHSAPFLSFMMYRTDSSYIHPYNKPDSHEKPYRRNHDNQTTYKRRYQQYFSQY